MVQRKPTPEEQLLKLIENPGAQAQGGAKASAAGTQTASRKKKGLPDFGKLAAFLSYFKKGLSKKGSASKREFHFDIKFANRILLAVVISSAVYLAADFFILKPVKGNFLSQVATSEKVYPVFQDSKNAASRDFSNYEKAIQKRNPFTPPGTFSAAPKDGEASAEQAASGPVAPNEPVINQMMSGLKLVGISWGAEPLAMIEDAESTRTYFVKKNGEVKGMKVQDISKEKVVLTYEGQEAELF